MNNRKGVKGLGLLSAAAPVGTVLGTVGSPTELALVEELTGLVATN